jgi:hypothetical protein
LGLNVERSSAEASDRGEDVVRGFGPSEWLGISITGVDVGGDYRFQRLGRAMGIAPDLLVSEECEEDSTWLIQDAEVGVKCGCQRGRLANQLRISLVLWLDALSMMT